MVHRKGSTRAFPPHHPLIPVDYQLTGQPVLIGGTMGSCSYVLTGTEKGMDQTFGYVFAIFSCFIKKYHSARDRNFWEKSAENAWNVSKFFKFLNLAMQYVVHASSKSKLLWYLLFLTPKFFFKTGGQALMAPALPPPLHELPHLVYRGEIQRGLSLLNCMKTTISIKLKQN